MLAVGVILYFYIDSQLFYYGKNFTELFKFNNLQLTPKYKPDFEGGFCFLDSNGFEVVGKGFKYKGIDTMEVHSILRYGFNNERIVILIQSVKGGQYFLEFNSNTMGSVNIIMGDKFYFRNNFKWIDIKNDIEKVKIVELIRNYIVLFFFFIVLIILFRIFRTIRI